MCVALMRTSVSNSPVVNQVPVKLRGRLQDGWTNTDSYTTASDKYGESAGSQSSVAACLLPQHSSEDPLPDCKQFHNDCLTCTLPGSKTSLMSPSYSLFSVEHSAHLDMVYLRVLSANCCEPMVRCNTSTKNAQVWKWVITVVKRDQPNSGLGKLTC